MAIMIIKCFRIENFTVHTQFTTLIGNRYRLQVCTVVVIIKAIKYKKHGSLKEINSEKNVRARKTKCIESNVCIIR